MSGAHVALMRAVNVGGTGKLPMAELAAIFTTVGCSNVRTYIQSGNVVMTAPDRIAEALPAVVSDEIQRRFAITTPVILRSAREMRRVIENNPFLARGVGEGELHVMFLDAQPAASAKALDPERSPPDAFVLRGRDLYLHFPNGTARSKLTNVYVEKTLGVSATVRNWRTVLKLEAMAREIGAPGAK